MAYIAYCPGLGDSVVGLVDSVSHLLDGRAKFLGKIFGANSNYRNIERHKLFEDSEHNFQARTSHNLVAFAQRTDLKICFLFIL